MSYDVDFEIDTGAGSVVAVGDSLNYTWNCSPMFYRALEGGIPALDGKRAVDAIPKLRKAVDDMRASPDVYEPMNPPNGWGSYRSAIAWLEEILVNAVRHPHAIIRIS